MRAWNKLNRTNLAKYFAEIEKPDTSAMQNYSISLLTLAYSVLK